MARVQLDPLRSRRWFGGNPLSIEHTGHALQSGYAREEFEGPPVVGIINTWSDLNPCHDRMSGTSYGTCVLHVSPESHVGGRLALVREGDEIELDVPNRRLTLCVDDAEIEKRRRAWTPPEPRYRRGWGKISSQNVTQAHEGCDFEVLASREPTPEPAIHSKA